VKSIKNGFRLPDTSKVWLTLLPSACIDNLVNLDKKTARKSAIFSLVITSVGFGQDEVAFKAGSVLPRAGVLKVS
jgi:hypothetical protein